MNSQPRVRSLFISDLHMGTRACKAEGILDILREYPCERLYLLGDIIDIWAMNRGLHWTTAQNTVVQKVLRLARHGCEVTYIPGNHDEFLREHLDMDFGGILFKEDMELTMADGKRYWLLHGDIFDQITRHHRWVAVLGDWGYDVLVRINHVISIVRRRLGIAGYWSLAGYAKRKIKGALEFIFHFEDAVAHATRHKGLDGVICGHIHSAADKRIDGVHYLNCGDWVDSCTAIVEHFDGRLEIVHGDPAPELNKKAALPRPPEGGPSTGEPSQRL